MTVWINNTSVRATDSGPVLFLDRDGVVIADENYLSDPELVRILPGVPEALRRARDAGFLLVGVSNQSGIGRGYFSEDDLDRVMRRLADLLAEEGVVFDSFHYCPHGPGQGCSCRKPEPGLLDEARLLHNIDVARSWMIGDKASDVAFGRLAGMGGVLVRTGYGAAQEAILKREWGTDPRVLVADDLPAAVARILEYPDQGGRS